MPEARKVKVKNPEFKSFKVLKDKRAGYKVSLSWEYNDPEVVGFRVYKAIVSKPLLQKNYLISQKALEKLTHAKTPKFNSQILYDKNYFVESSKTKFDQSYASKFEVKSSVPKSLNYFDIGFIRKNPKGEYEITDKNVKFGMSYSYVVSAFTKNLQETDPGRGLIVNVEDLSPPPPLEDFDATPTYSGILLSFSSHNNDVEGYKVFRRTLGNVKFEEIFDGPTTGQSSLLDNSVMPGNEYEYKVYLYDYFKNVGWSSKVKRVEFKSKLLNKGAVIDPLVQIRFESPNMIIEGRKNNQRIVGYRVERQDLWMYEKDFSIKEYIEIPWPNVVQFDENNEMMLVDHTVVPGRTYRYRISSISNMGKIESLYVSPPLDPSTEPIVTSPGFVPEEIISPRVKFFDTDIMFPKQDPVYVKLFWEIEGDWEYLKISGKNVSVRVDNIHNHIFLDSLEKEKTYNLKLEVFNLADQLVAVSNSVRFTIWPFQDY